jgi:hypothetical protein
MARNYGARPLNLAVQANAIRSGWPGFNVIATPCRLVATGAMKPSPLSRTYAVRVEYVLAEAPKTFVETPKLTRRADAPDDEIPHTYDAQIIGKERPCTFFPPADWNSTLKLSRTVLPWLASWLVDYELWHATGVWSGGGVSHSRRINDGSFIGARQGAD